MDDVFRRSFGISNLRERGWMMLPTAIDTSKLKIFALHGNQCICSWGKLSQIMVVFPSLNFLSFDRFAYFPRLDLNPNGF